MRTPVIPVGGERHEVAIEQHAERRAAHRPVAASDWPMPCSMHQRRIVRSLRPAIPAASLVVMPSFGSNGIRALDGTAAEEFMPTPLRHDWTTLCYAAILLESDRRRKLL